MKSARQKERELIIGLYNKIIDKIIETFKKQAIFSLVKLIIKNGTRKTGRALQKRTLIRP